MIELEEQARNFAIWCHSRQKRKYTGVAYCYHPEEVVHILKTMSGPHGYLEETYAAAWLHDVVEDWPIFMCKADPQKDPDHFIHCQVFINNVIGQMFGRRVAQLVDEVTDCSLPRDGNRSVRKQIDREHLAKSSPAGASIKLADLISNSRDIIQNDPDFAVVYMREKADLLPILQHGNRFLWGEANRIVVQYYTERSQKSLTD